MSQPTATVGAFAGDRKHGQSILGPLERRFIDHWVQRLPRWLRSWQLTLLTVPWSVGTVVFGWLAGERPAWLWAMSLMVAAQWFTDSFDGTLGRTRGEGLVKWGFFMDHFLDTVFAGSVVIGYSFIAPGGAGLLLQLLLLVTCSMMALSFLAFAATNQFQIAFYGIGPTEVRIGYIALNAFVFFAGPEVFWWGLPLVLALNLTVLCFLAYTTHCKLWALDKSALPGLLVPPSDAGGAAARVAAGRVRPASAVLRHHSPQRVSDQSTASVLDALRDEAD